jgi:hypothetical protein
MGHAEHFLRRLDRVADHHVELSLTLYRDEALLKEVLSRAELPPGIGRLAISLEDPIEGPFIIVTREGRFVTCLAKGMLIGSDVALLTRPRLDAAIAKVERMRERMSEVAALRESGAEGVAGRIFRRMRDDGLRFCREDAETLLEVWPLVGSEGVARLVDVLQGLRQTRKEVSYLRFEKLTPRERDFALQYGRMAWMAAHLLVLTTQAGSDAAFTIVPDIDARFVAIQSLFELSSFAHSTRALWAVAQRPKQFLPQLKAMRDDPRIEMRQLREMGLGITALASPKLRAEATKALLRDLDELPSHGEDALADAEKKYLHALGGLVRSTLEDEDSFDASALQMGREVCAGITHGRAPTEEEAGAIDEPLARAIFSNLSLTWRTDGELMGRLVFTMPWLARARPEELFLPRDFVQHLHPTGVEDIAEVMSAYAKSRRLDRPDPVKSAAKVGRNDPCLCGSGKKFKRCCDGK